MIMDNSIPAAGKRTSLVDLLLEVDKLSIHYQVEIDPEEMDDFARRSAVYNGLERENLIRFVRYVNSAIPKIDFGASNPNSGRAFHKFHVGNEGSRVIYIHVAKFYLYRHSPEEWTDEKIRILGDSIARFAKKNARADEADIVKDDAHALIIRVWWD